MIVKETIETLESIIDALKKEDQQALCVNYRTGEPLDKESFQYEEWCDTEHPKNFAFYISR